MSQAAFLGTAAAAAVACGALSVSWLTWQRLIDQRRAARSLRGEARRLGDEVAGLRVRLDDSMRKEAALTAQLEKASREGEAAESLRAEIQRLHMTRAQETAEAKARENDLKAQLDELQQSRQRLGVDLTDIAGRLESSQGETFKRIAEETLASHERRLEVCDAARHARLHDAIDGALARIEQVVAARLSEINRAEINRTARQPGRFGSEIYNQLATMGRQAAALGRGLDTSVKTYNAMVSNLDSRILKKVRSEAAADGTTGRPISDIPEVTEAVYQSHGDYEHMPLPDDQAADGPSSDGAVRQGRSVPVSQALDELTEADLEALSEIRAQLAAAAD